MMRSPVRFGIVGCSSMGRTHAEAIGRVEGAELVACADHTAPAAESFGEAHDCDAYVGHADLFERADIDAVSVCTPNGTHADIVVDAGEAGLDVLCEKPLEITPARVNRMTEAGRHAGVTLACILQRRTLSTMRAAREVVRGGELGRLVLADVQVKWHREPSYYEGWHGTSALDGGVLFTQALHGVDLLQWIVGDVERVSGSLDTLHHDAEVPDTAAATVEFESGARGLLSATTATRPQFPLTLSLHGTEGSLRVTEDGVELFETGDGPSKLTLPDPPAGGGHAAQVRDFVAAVTDGGSPMVPPTEARKALNVVFAAEASDERGEWVSVTEFDGASRDD